MTPLRNNPERMRPQDYLEAAAVRLGEARRLEAHPGLSLYLAGVAVECLLRSRLDPTRSFDGRHDLRYLARATEFFDVGQQAARNRTQWLTTIVRLWRNSYRYMSDEKISRVLHMTKQYMRHGNRHELARLAANDALAAASCLFSAAMSVRRSDNQRGHP